MMMSAQQRVAWLKKLKAGTLRENSWVEQDRPHHLEPLLSSEELLGEGGDSEVLRKLEEAVVDMMIRLAEEVDRKLLCTNWLSAGHDRPTRRQP